MSGRGQGVGSRPLGKQLLDGLPDEHGAAGRCARWRNSEAPGILWPCIRCSRALKQRMHNTA